MRQTEARELIKKHLETTQKAALLKYWKHWQQLILNRPAVTGSTHTVKQQPC